MDAKVAECIVEAAQNEGHEIDVYEGYSGRGMYGSETTGIRCDGMRALLVGVALHCGNLDAGEDSEALEDVVTAMNGLRQDSLGMGIIVY